MTDYGELEELMDFEVGEGEEIIAEVKDEDGWPQQTYINGRNARFVLLAEPKEEDDE